MAGRATAPVLIAHLILDGLLLGIVLAVWWWSSRRLAGHFRTLHALCALGEGLLSAATPHEMLRKLAAALPDIKKDVTKIRLYLYNRRTRQLNRLALDAEFAPLAVDPETPPGQPFSGVALAFRNRTLLVIPDTRRTPLLAGPAAPGAVLYAPMFARGEVAGILEIEHPGQARRFSFEEQTVAQHLANQIAATLRLSEQRAIQEQVFRSEKLSAAGQVISGVAEDLAQPLAAIAERTRRLLSHEAAGPDGALAEEILAESRRAAEIVARLVQFAHVETAEVQQVDLNDLLAELRELREPAWNDLGLVVRIARAEEPVPVLGSATQLKQVFSTLAALAEEYSAHGAARTLSISTKVLAHRALVEMSFPSTPAETDQEARGLGVIRGIVRNHGGELRFRRTQSEARFEVDLPAALAEESPECKTEPGPGLRPLTALLVEPDASALRQLLLLLSQRGHRVVPVPNAEEAIDLAGRLPFDCVCCSASLPGLNWVEFFHRVRHQTGAFVLLTEGFDTELARTFQDGESYLLNKPVQTGEFDRVFTAVETKLAGAA